MSRRRTVRESCIGLAAALSLLGLVEAASAAPMSCPLEQGFEVCTLVDGNTSVEVRATGLGGGQLLVTQLVLDGVNHIGLGSAQGFAIYDLIDGTGVDSDLDFITADPVTGMIEAQFTQDNGAFRVGATFTLSSDQTSVSLDETFTLTALVNGLVGRVYAVTDYDIKAKLDNDSIIATNDGAVTTQVEDDTTGIVEVTAGPLPDAFEVGACCDPPNLLSILFDNQMLELSGATTAPGPADFVSALSWDRSLNASDVFQVSLRKTIVPEPTHALAAASAALLGLALARRAPR